MNKKLVVTGRVLYVTEKYIVTTDGLFNKKWYRMLDEVESAVIYERRPTKNAYSG